MRTLGHGSSFTRNDLTFPKAAQRALGITRTLSGSETKNSFGNVAIPRDNKYSNLSHSFRTTTAQNKMTARRCYHLPSSKPTSHSKTPQFNSSPLLLCNNTSPPPSVPKWPSSIHFPSLAIIFPSPHPHWIASNASPTLEQTHWNLRTFVT